MKHPKVQILIDHLRNLDNSDSSKLGFDMDCTFTLRFVTDHPCGSACCIGGHACSVLKGMGLFNGQEVVEGLSALCEIEDQYAQYICWPRPNGWYVNYEKTTLAQAISVLEHFRDTGEVDWTNVVKEQEMICVD